MTTDPLPWRHASGTRVAEPNAPDAPRGGYTWSPRHGYSDHGTRYRSTRWRDDCGECETATREEIPDA